MDARGLLIEMLPSYSAELYVEEPRLPASVPEGSRIYAIGDIHGRATSSTDCLR